MRCRQLSRWPVDADYRTLLPAAAPPPLFSSQEASWGDCCDFKSTQLLMRSMDCPKLRSAAATLWVEKKSLTSSRSLASQNEPALFTTCALAKGPPAFSTSAQCERTKSHASFCPAEFTMTAPIRPKLSCERTSGEIA